MQTSQIFGFHENLNSNWETVIGSFHDIIRPLQCTCNKIELKIVTVGDVSTRPYTQFNP